MFLYPEDLKAKATLWLWELRDVTVIGVGCLLSVLAAARTGALFPLVATALYAFLSIRLEGASILDFLRYAVRFLILDQQYYEWGETIDQSTEEGAAAAADHPAAHGNPPAHGARRQDRRRGAGLFHGQAG